MIGGRDMTTPFFCDAIRAAEREAMETGTPRYVVFVARECLYAVTDADGLNGEFRGSPVDYATEE